MEHAEARELLEIAAVEPGGLDRLMAGDTIEASALAGHLAGCSDCADEMDRLRRASAVIRRGVALLPPPDLRERTLAFVAAVGRPRGSGLLAGASSIGSAAGSAAVAEASAVAPRSDETEPVELERARRRRDVRAATGAGLRPRMLAAWAASIAAAIVLSVVGTVSLVDRQRDDVADAQAQQIASLARVADWTLRLDADPDAKYVELASTATDATATVAFSGASRQLVVLANGLADPPPGMEYRCWLESGGTREPIGKMFFAGDVSYWAGDVPTATEALPGTRFGVSLVPIDGSPVGGDPVLLGEL